jgi:recombination protein RecA
MPITVKSKAGQKTTVSMAGLLTTFKKDMGDGIGSFGGALIDRERIPTGIFELDLAIGGGLPRGKVSIVYGPESSGKTNAVLLAIANHQKLWPDLTCAIVDLEHAFDPEWAKLLGVDTDKLMIVQPDYAEQAVDIVESLLMADDCGLVAMDSLAALVTTSELDSSADKAVVGGAALVIGKLYRKTTHALQQASKAGRFPTLVYVNQITHKIGVMFGDPETTPGGNKPRFQSSMTIRLYGKNKIIKEVSSTMPVVKETTFIIRKWKAPIKFASGAYELVMMAHNGLQPGMSDDFGTVAEYLKTWGDFKKVEKGQGWLIHGEEYKTIDQFKQRYYSDQSFASGIRKHVINTIMTDGEQLVEGGSN